MTTEDVQAEFRLEGTISSLIFEAFVDELGKRGLRCAGRTYELEETDDPDGPLVLVGKDSGRYEVDLEVFVRKLKAKPVPPDPDAPVHIEGQEELALGIGAS